MALDIISTLNCDVLQEELEREWKGYLDGKKLDQEEKEKWGEGGFGAGADASFGGGGGWDDGVQHFGGDSESNNNNNNNNNMDRWKNGNEGHGDGNEQLDDYVNRRRRRLSDEMDFPDVDDYNGGEGEGAVGDDAFNMGDFNNWNNEEEYGVKLTARHLFCLAADALILPKADAPDESSPASSTIVNPTIHCDITTFETRESLLYLWSSARSQMPMDILTKTLRLVSEHKETLRGNEVHLWYPEKDEGTKGMLRVLNSGFEGRKTYNFDSEPADESHDNLYRFWDLPSRFMGPNKLFVDVGSALGLTSMLVSFLYPGTTIVSIEPASPSWLIQNLNYRCNLPHDKLQYIHPILAGVGTKHHDDSDSMMKMVWRPSMTTATRSWNPEKQFDFAVDMELVVHLRTMRSILADATPEDLPLGTPISVLNLDCEGCEYNLIPSMHEQSFNSIGILLGRTNWGFIPTIKKPSSERAKTTHERVCTHYNFAKRCKECCDFPELTVKPRLLKNKAGGESSDFEHERDTMSRKTVAEVAGGLCDGFDMWAKDNHLHDIPDDFGWNEMSAFAAFTE